MRRVLVTGASRGIGLELVRQLVEREDRVFAGYRSASTASRLLKLSAQRPGHLTAVEMDVTDERSIDGAYGEVAHHVDGLDVLVNNAGIGSDSRDFDDRAASAELGSLRAGPMLRILHTNSVAPVLVAQRFLPMLRKGRNPRIVNISSEEGSISQTNGGDHTYRASKAALNMFTRNLAIDLRDDAIIVVMVHPGWVRTDMGGPNGPLSVEEAVHDLVKVFDGLTLERTGSFLDWRGHPMPW